MVKRAIFCLLSVLVSTLFAANVALSQEAGRKVVISENGDYYGYDISTATDVTLDQCQNICLTNKNCRAFTFNAKVNWCFMKSDFGRLQTAEGSIAGRVIEIGSERDLGAAPGLGFASRYKTMATNYRSNLLAAVPADLAESIGALIAKADRPLLLVGGGIHISVAYDALKNLAESQAIPVAHTLSGKGAIACTHQLSAGLFGRYSRIANDLIETSDCIIVVGCKLGEIATKRFQLFNGDTPIIHLETLPEEIGRTTKTDVALVGDAKLGLEDLADALHSESARAMAARAAYVAEVPRRMTKWRDGAKDRLEATETPINMGRMLNELNNEMPEESVLVVDGGFAAHWGGLLYDTKKPGRRFVADRGFASIGYGLPGAMGAQLAVPDQPVIGITGDGGFNMVLGELETARRAKTPFTLMIVNNAASGYIKALQHAMYGDYQSSDLIEMNYAEIAKDFGCQGIRVEDPEQIAPAIRAANDERTVPSIIDVVVTRDPAKMLPGVDNRTLKVTKGDRPV